MKERDNNAKDRGEFKTYRRLLRYARPYRGRLLLGVFFGMVCGGGTAGLLYAFQKSIAYVYAPDRALSVSFVVMTLLLPAMSILFGFGVFLSGYFVGWVGNRVVRDLRDDAFSHLLALPLQFYSGNRTGELISRTANDTMLVQRAVSTVIGDLIREPFILLGAMIYLFTLELRLSLLSILLFPICVIPVVLFGRRVRRFTREGQEKLANMVSVLQEAITGARVVKAFGMEQFEETRFRAQTREVFNRALKVIRARSANEPIIIVISSIGLALVLIYAQFFQMGVDELITYAAALVMMYRPARQLSRIHLNLQQSLAAAERVFEIIDTPPSVQNAPEAVPFEGPLRSIVFEHVSFAYEEQPVLEDINLRVEAGQCVALVGASGSGKTTLVSLLLRFFDVSGGRILLNDRDIRDYTIESLRKAIGLVTQETILFNDSVSANIAYGESSASLERIIEAARRAHAHEFIEQMPQGYETVIGERGVRLSGGQAQRLCIARALLRNPPLMILDEATSSLDTEAERQVQAAIDSLMADRTVFAIAHRLSTIAHADRIFVLDAGRIIEQGSHQELLDRGGQYRHLYDLQFDS